MIKAFFFFIAFGTTDLKMTQKTNSGTLASKGGKSLNKKRMETHFVISEHYHHALNCYYMKRHSVYHFILV